MLQEADKKYKTYRVVRQARVKKCQRKGKVQRNKATKTQDRQIHERRRDNETQVNLIRVERVIKNGGKQQQQEVKLQTGGEGRITK